MSRSPFICTNYEVVFSGQEVLLTFDASDVAFLKGFVLKENGENAEMGTRLSGAPQATAVALKTPAQLAQTGVHLNPDGEQGGSEGTQSAVVAGFGEHGEVVFPNLPAVVEEAARAAGKLWVVALDGEGVVSEAALPLA